MKHKKASTSEKADKFLQSIGTAGGPIGSPQLIGFGGTDVQSQLAAGNSDEYAAIRMRQGDTRVVEAAKMPSDLDASYLKLNLPGSPLPANGLLAPQNMVAAEKTRITEILSHSTLVIGVLTFSSEFLAFFSGLRPIEPKISWA